MLNKALYYLCYFFSLLGIMFGILTYGRWHMPYDETGRYFEATESIVYHLQEMEMFAVISGSSLLIAFILLIIALIRSR